MIKNFLKKILNYNKYTRRFYKLITIFRTTIIIKESGKRKGYPKVLQLPITNKCNSNCVMCNIPNINKKKEISLNEFNNILKDPIFKQIESVGINGGEPYLLNDLFNYIEVLIKNLTNLKNISIISNGFCTDKILSVTPKIHTLCKENNIKLNLTISLDGYKEIHDKVRGVIGAFNRTEKTIESIYENIEKYADNFSLACTVVRQNVDNLIELDEYCKLKGYSINYRLGIKNLRIDNELLMDSFSVLSDKRAKQLATEFFFDRFKETNDFKYYAIYKYLAYNSVRALGCDWKENGITMDPYGNIYYCAVESKKIGNLKEDSGEDKFFNKNNINYRADIIKNKCNNCIHDYCGTVTFNETINYYKELHKSSIFLKSYRRN